jgi:opacity protein-like surface antigen
MKMTKGLLLAHVLMLSAFTTFAESLEDNDSTEVVQYSDRSNIENYKYICSDSDETDLRHIEFGIRYMPTFSSLDIHTSDGGVLKGSATMSNGFGIMGALNFTKHLGIHGEINYYIINQKYADGNFNHDLSINYFNIPIMLSLNTNKTAPVNFNFVAGPQFGISAGSKFETTGNGSADSTTAVVGLKKGDMGFAYGAGLELALNKNHTIRLDLGFRGFYGLVNMDSSSNGQGTYNVIVSASRKSYGGYLGFTWLF